MAEADLDESAQRRRLLQGGAVVAGVAGVLSGLFAARLGTRVARHYARVATSAAVYVLRAATFTLHRRCPDCHSRIDARARVCRRCGFRFAAQPTR